MTSRPLGSTTKLWASPATSAGVRKSMGVLSATRPRAVDLLPLQVFLSKATNVSHGSLQLQPNRVRCRQKKLCKLDDCPRCSKLDEMAECTGAGKSTTHIFPPAPPSAPALVTRHTPSLNPLSAMFVARERLSKPLRVPSSCRIPSTGKSVCSACKGPDGVFCEMCLRSRYGLSACPLLIPPSALVTGLPALLSADSQRVVPFVPCTCWAHPFPPFVLRSAG